MRHKPLTVGARYACTHARRPASTRQSETRRNVIAMAGILASTVVAATLGATKSAHAISAGWGSSGGSSGASSGAGSTSGCFLCGTKILTDVGETPIEKLEVGDMVSTVSGEMRAIKRVISWKAERKSSQDWSDDVAPIKICRSALAPNVPHRDLYLSPAHALYIDGVLICASGLVNGRSIARCSKGDETGSATSTSSSRIIK